MRAVLLAAGRGRRLESDGPKCLLAFDGKTLLERHVANLVESGVTALTIVVGYKREMIDAAVAKLGASLPIEVIENKRFVHGSIVSLQCAGARLEEGAIWMDADVLYPAGLMRRLVGSAQENCVLLDARSDETGEEMMLGSKDGRVLKIARRVGPDWDVAGESVGFFKVGPAGGAVMRRLLDEEVASGRLDQEYEAALDRAFAEVPFGFERVDEFAWTEIDFQEDIAQANELVKKL